MAKYPRIEKGSTRLGQDDNLRGPTTDLLISALMSAGILLSGAAPVDAQPTNQPTLSTWVSPGKAIVLMKPQGNTVLTGHYSHASHASHASHHSHYSSRY